MSVTAYLVFVLKTVKLVNCPPRHCLYLSTFCTVYKLKQINFSYIKINNFKYGYAYSYSTLSELQ